MLADGLDLSQLSTSLAEGLGEPKLDHTDRHLLGCTGGGRDGLLISSALCTWVPTPSSPVTLLFLTQKQLGSFGAVGVLHSPSLQTSIFKTILQAGKPITTLGRMCLSSPPSLLTLVLGDSKSQTSPVLPPWGVSYGMAGLPEAGMCLWDSGQSVHVPWPDRFTGDGERGVLGPCPG